LAPDRPAILTKGAVARNIRKTSNGISTHGPATSSVKIPAARLRFNRDPKKVHQSTFSSAALISHQFTQRLGTLLHRRLSPKKRE